MTLDKIISIYHVMVDRKICKSRRDFATNWLGRAHNYLTVHANRQRFSADTALSLVNNLNKAGHHDLASILTLDMFSVPVTK